MAANPDEMEKTDEMVIAFLVAQKRRLSGNAFKIVFEITMRWRFAVSEEVRISIPSFEDETGLSRNTVRSSIAEARGANAVRRTRKGSHFLYSPNFDSVRNLPRPSFTPVQISDAEKLFERWAFLFNSAESFDAAKREVGERILRVKSFDECVQAAEGYTAAATGDETGFETIFRSEETVEKGIILYEFLTTREEDS